MSPGDDDKELRFTWEHDTFAYWLTLVTSSAG